jgi:hypothetical protein
MLPFEIHLNAATGSAVCNRSAAESTNASNGPGPMASAPPAVATAATAKTRVQRHVRSPNTTHF